MSKTKMLTEDFYNDFFRIMTISPRTNKHKIIKPLRGDYLIINENNEVFQSEDLINKTFKFQKNQYYTILFFNTGDLTISGAINMDYEDSSYNNLPTDSNISYQITLRYQAERYQQFFDFVTSFNWPNSVGSLKSLKEFTMINTESIIKNRIVRELNKDTVQEVKSILDKLNGEILEELNSNKSNLYDYGFIVKDFKIDNLTENFIDREEKKRIRRNEFLNENF